jgi:hypothetical protein
MKAIYDAKGCLVEGLGDRVGVRRVFSGDTRNNKRGGIRVKDLNLYDPKHYWLHPDAQAGIQVKLEDSIVKFQGEEMVGIETGDDDEASLLLEEDGEKRTRESVGANSEVGSGVG